MSGDPRDATHELDDRWCAFEDARALGEDPPHAAPPPDPRWQGAWEREHAFYAALADQAAGASPGEVPTADDLALVDAVLVRHAATGPAASHDDAPQPAARHPWRARGLVVALAVAAAVVLAVVALTPALGLRGSEGAWIAEQGQRRHGPGDALPLAMWLVAEDHACATLEDASLCATAGTRLRLHEGDRGHPRVEVGHGTVTIDGALVVSTARGDLGAGDESRFEVTVAADGSTVEILAEHGPLALVTPDGTRPIDAGARLRLGAEPTPALVPTPPAPALPPASTAEPAATRPTPRAGDRLERPATDPAALLVQARARLAAGDDKGAAKVYATLIEGHPASAEAQPARVSLGQLRLAAGKPKAALASFDRYLQRGGPLAEEALWGKIQALAALGRTRELAAAVDRLVREQPRSVYRTRAQALVGR